MKRNTFFVRFYLSSLAEEGQGLGLVSEQYFTTKQEYVFEYPEGKSEIVSGLLNTGPGQYSPGIADSSNGCILVTPDVPWPGMRPGVIYVDFGVDETPGEMFKIMNPEIKYNIGYNRFVDIGFSTTGFELAVTAYAIGVVDDTGQINGTTGVDNVRWIMNASFRDLNRSLLPKKFYTSKWMDGSAFSKPTFLPINRPIEDVIFKEVYTEHIPTEESDCCVANANSLALVAAASLIASNNATSPLLIKQLEHAVTNEFDAKSTISALQSMRQLGTLSNVTGKVLDNAIPKSNDVVIIKNGPQE